MAVISEIAGKVEITEGQRREATITGDDGEAVKYLIPFGAKLKVKNGDTIEAGDELTDGSINPNDILKIKGRKGRAGLYAARKFRTCTVHRALR